MITRENIPGRYILNVVAPGAAFLIERVIRADGTYESSMGFGGVLNPNFSFTGHWTLEDGKFIGRQDSKPDWKEEIDFSNISRESLKGGATVNILTAAPDLRGAVTYPYVVREIDTPYVWQHPGVAPEMGAETLGR